MKKRTSPSLVKDLTEAQVRRYLLANGWFEDGTLKGVAWVWHRHDSNDAEVVLPVYGQARDFSARIFDSISALSEFERRELTDITSDIKNLSVDIIGIKVSHQDVEGGSIPLNDGVLLIERARDLMISVVLSALDKKKHFTGVRPKEANDYIEKLRLGQTEVGSYVVNVLVPISAEEEKQEDLDKTSFARIVTRNLSSGLSALREALTTFRLQGDPQVFEKTVERGVSSNMCEALLGLSGATRTRTFSIVITPAPAERQIEDQSLTFEFGSYSIEALESAMEFFGENYVLSEKRIEGFIKRLDRTPGEENGSVTIFANLSGNEKNVVVELSANDYLEAIHAHEQKFIVQCVGDLHVSSRSAKLLSPNGFKVVRNDELF